MDSDHSVSEEGTGARQVKGSPSEAHPEGPIKRGSDLLDRLKEELAPAIEVVHAMGEGSDSQMFMGREPGLDRLVAIKVLLPETASDETARRRFDREARSVASLSHPNVVSIYRFGVLSDESPYLIMQYVKGRNMAERLKAERTLSVEEGRAVIAQVASALGDAHKHGIVHRDVRPENVLHDEESGRALLRDFGIAGLLETGVDQGTRLTKVGQVLGNPKYTSPEQLMAEDVTERSDVYSLGVLGYELLTGGMPYRARTNQEMLTAHLRAEPLDLRSMRPDVDAETADLLARCLAKTPSHRPNADDVAKALVGGPRISGAYASVGMATGAHSVPVLEEEGFFRSVVRRRILQFLGASALSGWGLVEMVDSLIGKGFFPEVSYLLAWVVAGFGVLSAAVISWFHGERGRQTVPTVEKWLLGAIGVGWLITTAMVLRK